MRGQKTQDRQPVIRSDRHCRRRDTKCPVQGARVAPVYGRRSSFLAATLFLAARCPNRASASVAARDPLSCTGRVGEASGNVTCWNPHRAAALGPFARRRHKAEVPIVSSHAPSHPIPATRLAIHAQPCPASSGTSAPGRASTGRPISTSLRRHVQWCPPRSASLTNASLGPTVSPQEASALIPDWNK